MDDAVFETNLPYPLLKRGKVRDVYDLDPFPFLLIIATDRISAFDCIMPTSIPGKGKILTAMSNFWFEKYRKQFQNHLAAMPGFEGMPPELDGRAVVVHKTDVVPIECVARGYLAGSAWKEYQSSQTVCGIKLPPGLRQCDKLPAPIFTPATKEESGHDINVDFAETIKRVGEETANQLRERTLSLYTQAADYAASRGIIIADTKFEFGKLLSGELILIDEILTPDSSRFWPADQYQPGRDQPSFDKQFLRNWLESQLWDKTPPAPALPKEVVEGTRRRYLDAYEKLTSQSMSF